MFDFWSTNEPLQQDWINLLPPPFETIQITTNSLGEVSACDPEPNGFDWNPPEKVEQSIYIHHDAVYEMRSTPVPGRHGHQATYDSNGVLIRSGIAAGTADKVSPASILNGSTSAHRDSDVKPFIAAIQLDGNPVRPTNMTDWFTEAVPSRLNRPCLYEGKNLRKYIECRPTLPTGTRP